VWRTCVRPMLETGSQLLVLGHAPAPAGLFFGSHCYALSLDGARILLEHAFPIQLHLDVFLGHALQRGLVRGRVWRPSLAGQCAAGTIGHYDGAVGYKRAVPDTTPRSVLLWTLTFTGATLGPAARRRRRPSARWCSPYAPAVSQQVKTDNPMFRWTEVGDGENYGDVPISHAAHLARWYPSFACSADRNQDPPPASGVCLRHPCHRRASPLAPRTVRVGSARRPGGCRCI
jgi:hypothetical protein